MGEGLVTCMICNQSLPVTSFPMNGTRINVKKCKECGNRIRRESPAKPALLDGEKICCRCKKLTPLTEFHKNRNSRDGRAAACKACAIATVRQWQAENRERHRAKCRDWHSNNRGRNYGLTPDQYFELELESGGVCGLCHQAPTPPRDRLVVDHDHSTGKVRGMLCWQCNAGMGNLNDDPDLLNRAAAYIREHRS